MAIINDGFSTTITFGATQSGVSITTVLKEKTVTPPSVEGGGENDTTTMRNTAWRTRQPKSLLTLGEASFTAAYDAAVYDEIVDLTNVNQEITVTFPAGDTLVFWGWIDGFVPNEISEGEQPTAECRIICSNQNDSGVETAPVYST